MAQIAPCEPENILGGFKDASATGMQQEALDVINLKPMVREEAIDRWAELTSQKCWKGRAQHNSEAILFDVPAHNVESVGPAMLAECDNPAGRRFARACHVWAAQEHRSSAIAKKRERNEIGNTEIVAPSAKTAQIYGEEKDISPWHGLRDADGASQSTDTSAAA
jgi:hypothetical protein